MDPLANLNEQRALVVTMLSDNDYIDSGDAVRLAELVMALDEWRTNGGFDPYLPALEPESVPNHAQAIALGRFLRNAFRDERPGYRHATVMRGGLGLPDTYVAVRTATGYEGGIDSDGSVST